MWNRFLNILFFCIFFVPSQRFFAQDTVKISPLEIPLLLSGSFGELRGTHFHSGLDFRTQGKEGLPVYCVEDGVLVRVKVSAGGYGNALYVEHKDGTTTVYAHLSAFHPAITEVVRMLQYRNECFELDAGFREYGLVFSKGEIIGNSGNSGSSGGPHLHFEYRVSETQQILNPLHHVSVKDQIAPHPRVLYLYALDSLDYLFRAKRVETRKVAAGKYSCGKITVPPGRIGVGVFVTDFMNDSWSKLGVYRINLKVDGTDYFSWSADTATFEGRRFIHEIKDFQLYREKRETVYRTFGRHISEMPGVRVRGEGFIVLEHLEEKQVEMLFSDYNGNVSTLSLMLRADECGGVEARDLLLYGESHVLDLPPYHLHLPASALFYSVERLQRKDTMEFSQGVGEVFVVSEVTQPLCREAILRVKGDFDAGSQICLLNEKKAVEVVKTYRDAEGIYAYVGMLGKYAVVRDTVAPEVSFVGKEACGLVFRIRDNLSGIASYRGEVNGRWCLFQYDAKTGRLWCELREASFYKEGRDKIVLRVVDKAGWETTVCFEWDGRTCRLLTE